MSYYIPGLPSIGNTNVAPGAYVNEGSLKLALAKLAKSERAKKQQEIKNTEKSIKAEKTKLTTAEKGVATKQAEIVAYKKAQTPKLAPEGPGIANLTQATYLSKLEQEKAAFKKQVTASQAKLTSLNTTLTSLKTELQKISLAASTGQFSRSSTALQINTTFNTSSGVGSGDADKLIYTYNLPMLKHAYLNPMGPQGKSVIDPKSLASPEFANARAAWTGVTASRGTIQMSRLFAENAIEGKKKKLPKGTVRNETPYGFRFLYNPTEVTMAWGIVDAFSPEYAQSGENGMTGTAIGIMKGTIAFTLLLNRIGDMNVLQDDGSYANYFFKDDPEFNPNVYSQVRYPAVGTQVVPVVPTPVIPPINPWGLKNDPSLEERAELAKRGTMYDIEYLFKAMAGFYPTYESGLNGKTADRGWLQPIPLELTLGAGMRYLVRVSSLDLKHMMFNERMVPILTTVNVVCTRYYDSPDAFGRETAYSPEKDPSK